MITKSFEEIRKADLDALVADQVAERRTLEYKRNLPGRDDTSRKEFLADVTHLHGSVLEYRLTSRLVPLKRWIEAHFHPGPYFPRAVSGLGQAYFGGTAQAKIPPVTMFLDPADPALRSSRPDYKIQAIAVSYATEKICCIYC